MLVLDPTGTDPLLLTGANDAQLFAYNVSRFQTVSLHRVMVPTPPPPPPPCPSVLCLPYAVQKELRLFHSAMHVPARMCSN